MVTRGNNVLSGTQTDTETERHQQPMATGCKLLELLQFISSNSLHISSAGPDILSAPLQTVLDNLDVLEELVILLDPDNQIVKSTKHLASLCSFPSTWITYTYSMKDSKSPLKAVLEGVTSRHPDWTVANFAKLLRQMERNDAIAVLARIGLNEIAM